MNKQSFKVVMMAALVFSSAATTALLTGCANTPTQESAGQYMDNSGITANVKAKLLGANGIDSNDISVTTYKGVVQLSGFVPSVAQKNRAASIAASVPGVTGVRNDLIIRTHIQ